MFCQAGMLDSLCVSTFWRTICYLPTHITLYEPQSRVMDDALSEDNRCPRLAEKNIIFISRTSALLLWVSQSVHLMKRSAARPLVDRANVEPSLPSSPPAAHSPSFTTFSNK